MNENHREELYKQGKAHRANDEEDGTAYIDILTFFTLGLIEDPSSYDPPSDREEREVYDDGYFNGHRQD